MPKEKIAIISILKPVDDTRSYEKFARTLSENQAYEIHLYGRASQSDRPPKSDIYFHPHTTHPKGFLRIWVRLQVLFSILKLKHKLIIVNTHELLIVTILHQILFGSKIIYDIQENYYFNLKHQGNYHKWISTLLANLVRLKERILSPAFDHFILAEKCYQDELPFLENRYMIVENKAIIPLDWKRESHDSSKIKLIFTGTLTQSNGAYKALILAQLIHENSPEFSFTFAGHCPDTRLWKVQYDPKYSFIDWQISDAPVPHDEILEQIQNANFGLVCYDLNPSNQNCLPTKVYEYLALGLPMIYENSGAWSSVIDQQNAGICIQYDKANANELITQIKSYKIPPQTANEPMTWPSESSKLESLISKLIENN